MNKKRSRKITRYQLLVHDHAETLVELQRIREELYRSITAHRTVNSALELLTNEFEKVRRERDAAMADITEASPCFACKHFKRNGGTCGGGKRCLEEMLQAEAEGREYKGLYWEWRGVQEGKDTNVRSNNAESKKESVCPINGAPCSECKPGSPCAREVKE